MVYQGNPRPGGEWSPGAWQNSGRPPESGPRGNEQFRARRRVLALAAAALLAAGCTDGAPKTDAASSERSAEPSKAAVSGSATPDSANDSRENSLPVPAPSSPEVLSIDGLPLADQLEEWNFALDTNASSSDAMVLRLRELFPAEFFGDGTKVYATQNGGFGPYSTYALLTNSSVRDIVAIGAHKPDGTGLLCVGLTQEAQDGQDVRLVTGVGPAMRFVNLAAKELPPAMPEAGMPAIIRVTPPDETTLYTGECIDSGVAK